MPEWDLPDLSRLVYEPQNFRDLYETDLGRAIWQFMIRPDNVVRMLTATYLDRAAVEPLAPGLLREFGPDIAQDRLKQIVGHMGRQIMEATGLELDKQGMRITRESIFTTATRYMDPNAPRGRAMTITAEQRKTWMEKTAASPFNSWLNDKVRNADGSLNLERLYEVARLYGIETEYRHLNPGQQRMSIGIQLRKKVPTSEYEGSLGQ